MSPNNIAISDLEVGMKVLFHNSTEDVHNWRGWANDEFMPTHLGRVNTIRKIDRLLDIFFIEEDMGDIGTGGDGWFWRAPVIKEIVYDDDFDEGGFDLTLLLR